MSLRTAIVQFAPTDEKSENLKKIDAFVLDAAQTGARLIVLPEYAIFTVEAMDYRFVDSAESLDGPSVSKLMELSAKYGVAIVAGINETAGNGKIHNTLVGIDGGTIKAIYRKVHLYDAFGYRESDRVLAADPSNDVTFNVDGFTVGMQTCYDLRFPELSRHLVDLGADVLALPAEWVPGPLKEYHWNTLIRARAIENTIYVVAADQSGPSGAGQSAIIDPMGNTIASIGEVPGLALGDLSKERIAEVRGKNPALSLRRFSVMPGAPQ